MLWGVFFFVLVFFSISATKLPHYGFYGLSGLIVLMAFTATLTSSAAVSKAGGDPNRPTFLVDRLFLAGLFFIVSAIPFWWGLISEQIADPYYRQVWDLTEIEFKANWAWFLFPLALGWSLFFLRSRFGLMLAGLFFTVFLHGVVIVSIVDALRGPIYLAAQEIRKLPSDIVITWRLAVPSLSFYSQRVIRPGIPAQGKVVVIHSKDLPTLKSFLRQSVNSESSIISVWEYGGIQIVSIK
jgi:hypothetical protein